MITNNSELGINQYKVLITTSGIGSRLGNLTDYTNKSLIPIGDKLAISYIVECYPKEVIFVVTLGHFGDHVRQFLSIAYPNRQFEFVEVSPYVGARSSLAFSMLQAKKNLQLPFIYHACDTLILKEKIPTPNSNWVAGFKNNDATNYASYDTSGSFIQRFHEKGMTSFDLLHIGLVGVNDYLSFWEELELILADNPSNNSINDVSVIQGLINKGKNFASIEVDNWIDIGNSNSLINAREMIGSKRTVLEKSKESVSFVENSVIKFFTDSETVNSRVNRATYLGELIPKIESYTNNFYRYRYEQGSLASNLNNPQIFTELLDWAQENLWIENPKYNRADFDKVCEGFYLKKTQERINQFLSSRSIRDKPSIINGLDVPSIQKLLEAAKEILLSDCKETGFHGDFILDNILVNDHTFKLIDWRQNFGASVQYGDIYYDISKLNHSLYVNHEIVNKGLFSIEEKNDQVECGILRKDVHTIMEKNLEFFAAARNLSLLKIRTLTAIIWINMSPLHHHPFDKFLYYYGKLNLWRAINEI